MTFKIHQHIKIHLRARDFVLLSSTVCLTMNFWVSCQLRNTMSYENYESLKCDDVLHAMKCVIYNASTLPLIHDRWGDAGCVSGLCASACEVLGYSMWGCGQRLWQLICCGHRDALLSCQVEQLKEELTHSQSEKEEIRQRANELQQEVSAVRDTPLCLFALSFLLFLLFPRLTSNSCCLIRVPVESQ